MNGFGTGSSRLLSRARELAGDPEATGWARTCAWVPGTGHCRRRDCLAACLFRSQREAEEECVQRWRRLRRIFATRPIR